VVGWGAATLLTLLIDRPLPAFLVVEYTIEDLIVSVVFWEGFEVSEDFKEVETMGE
jgi:hypothetical protein